MTMTDQLRQLSDTQLREALHLHRVWVREILREQERRIEEIQSRRIPRYTPGTRRRCLL